ncbi:MAG: hypothetical protein ACRDK5_05300 [Solirubrobacterales bacterium]
MSAIAIVTPATTKTPISPKSLERQKPEPCTEARRPAVALNTDYWSEKAAARE